MGCTPCCAICHILQQMLQDWCRLHRPRACTSTWDQVETTSSINELPQLHSSIFSHFRPATGSLQRLDTGPHTNYAHAQRASHTPNARLSAVEALEISSRIMNELLAASTINAGKAGHSPWIDASCLYIL